MAKYQYGLSSWTPINTDNITNDLNNGISAMRRQVAENAITLVSKKDERFFPLRDTKPGDIAFVGFGITADNEFAKRMKTDYNATIFFATENDLINKLKKFKKVVVGIHNVGRFAASNFGFSKTNIDLLNTIQQNYNCISFLFGNAYALKNMCNAPNMVMCYEDDAIVQGTAVDLLQGKIFYKGTLPVTVCENLKYGFGVETKATVAMFEKKKNSSEQNINLLKIDSIANDAIAKKAMPGAVILALKNGEIVYDKAFGSYTYDNSTSVTMQTVYDMASVTKICATTLAVMKLFDEGKLDLKKLSDYLPEMMGTNKQNISVENLLLHQAGLVPYIPFYKEVIDSFGKPLPTVFSNTLNDTFGIKVADNLYMKNAWKDTMYKRIILSPVGPTGKYVYSDNDFILLAKIVEKITSKSIDEYVLDNFYTPMNLNSIGYDPLLRNCKTNIAPTENEKIFRTQLIQSYVHDPGAAMMGGIAGHAGLFSNAYDLAAIMQMLLNGGEFKGKNLLKKETIELFTTYHSSTSRRGYGFDKPEKDNATRAEPYPALAVSPLTFGHTGFTGTCVWADPAAKLVYIFLSNRVYPDVSTLLLKMNVRVKIFDTLIETFAN